MDNELVKGSGLQKAANILRGFKETDQVLANLEKANHKYFKREGTPGNYKYYYTEEEYKKAKGGREEKTSKPRSSEDNQSSDFTVGDTVKISAFIQSDPAGMKGQTVKVTKIDGDILHVKNSEGKTGMYMDNTVEKVEGKKETAQQINRQF